MNRKVVISLLIVLSLVFFLLAAYPSPVFSVFGFEQRTQQNLTRIVELIFTALLGLLGIIIGAVGAAGRRSTSIEAASLSLGTAAGKHAGHAEPCKKIVIFDRFGNDGESSAVIKVLRYVSVLGNVKPVITSSLSEAERQLELNSVLGVFCPEVYQEEFKRILQRNRGGLFIVRTGTKQLSIGQTAMTKTLQLPTSLSASEMSSIGDEVAKLHSLDAPRGVGFSGNWFGTYGLIALAQSPDHSVQGAYWYGGGEIEGKCEVDLENERLVLHFSWSQRNNEFDTGSRDVGEGVFVIPAGYELFYGYWYDRGEIVSSQTWCGARVSRDITDAAINEVSPFGLDLGLSVHGREKIFSWDRVI